MTTFAHAGDHHAALDVQHHLNSLRKAIVQPGLESHQSLGFNVQSLASEMEGLVVIEGHALILARDVAKRDYDAEVARKSFRRNINAQCG